MLAQDAAEAGQGPVYLSVWKFINMDFFLFLFSSSQLHSPSDIVWDWLELQLFVAFLTFPLELFLYFLNRKRSFVGLFMQLD